MTSYFGVMVLITLPAVALYALIFAFKARWWKSWIGFGLLNKATGLTLMLSFAALLMAFGPDYPFRAVLRDVGITLVCVGSWAAFIAMLREYRHKPRGLR